MLTISESAPATAANRTGLCITRTAPRSRIF